MRDISAWLPSTISYTNAPWILETYITLGATFQDLADRVYPNDLKLPSGERNAQHKG